MTPNWIDANSIFGAPFFALGALLGGSPVRFIADLTEITWSLVFEAADAPV